MNRRDQTPRTLALKNQFSQDSFDDMIPPSTYDQISDDFVTSTLSQLSVEGRKRMDQMVEDFIKVSRFLLYGVLRKEWCISERTPPS